MEEELPSRREQTVPLVSTHTHTDLSLCGRPDMGFAAVVAAAEELGFETVVLTDHVHVPTVTNYPRHLERLRQYKEWRAELGSAVEVVVGAEFEVTAPGRIVENEAFVEACECALVAPNHYHLDWVVMPRGSAAEVAAHELDAIETIADWEPAEVVAHPFAGTRLEHSPNALYDACDKGRLRELLQRARERGIGFEIQPKFWYSPQDADRLIEFFEIWLEMGGRVALGSDAHTLASLRIWAERYREIAARFGLTRDDLWLPKREGGVD